jgi:hypothetical protein
MTPTYAYNHGLRYRYYACSNHIRCKACESAFKTVPAEDVEQKVIDEVLLILRGPEIIANINKIANERSGINGSNTAQTKQNLVLALKNLAEIWTFLYPTEQHKVVSMLVEEVAIGDNGIRITLDLEGFDRVMREVT